MDMELRGRSGLLTLRSAPALPTQVETTSALHKGGFSSLSSDLEI